MHLLESPLPTGLLLPVCMARADMGLLNTSQLLALLPASSCPPLRHSIAWNLAWHTHQMALDSWSCHSSGQARGLTAKLLPLLPCHIL